MDALLAKLPIEHRTKAMENAIVDALEPTKVLARRLIPLRPKPKKRNQTLT